MSENYTTKNKTCLDNQVFKHQLLLAPTIYSQQNHDFDIKCPKIAAKRGNMTIVLTGL